MRIICQCVRPRSCLVKQFCLFRSRLLFFESLFGALSMYALDVRSCCAVCCSAYLSDPILACGTDLVSIVSMTLRPGDIV